MIIRSRAPLRLGLAGGGTDVSPYSDEYGGNILNATISLYAYATIIPRSDGKIKLISEDREESVEVESAESLEFDGKLDLLKGVYNRVVKQYAKKPLSFELHTFVDAPAGSGLGTSSTLVVAIIGAFAEWLEIPLGEYDIAKMAYEIERVEMGMSGGKQDQYAATFGGFNFMEFYADDKVVVNPLRIKQTSILELESNIVLYYTGTSRLSSKIIDAQIKNATSGVKKSVEAMHRLKNQAIQMKEALLLGKLNKLGENLHEGWEFKKQMTKQISNPMIDEIYDAARNAGCTGGKISGAGGGGFMFFYCPENTKQKVINALKPFGGLIKQFNFVEDGVTTWKIDEND
ncbi:dehydrogenase [Jiulongibacter sediminis]|uniref:GHMP family kinase ATP-binding protein n=1 Tax=Jiulongibacter sediminis TaxID=1605367 RepID=UPI0026F3284C|nr:dehydrogenase [Jiulongibacter sediminis]